MIYGFGLLALVLGCCCVQTKRTCRYFISRVSFEVMAHVSAVRSLYKRILMLHRFMPIDLRALGDQYVKDEFRRHKTASGEEVTRFMTEWQVRQKPAAVTSLTAEKTNAF